MSLLIVLLLLGYYFRVFWFQEKSGKKFGTRILKVKIPKTPARIKRNFLAMPYEIFCKEYPSSCEDQEDQKLVEWVRMNVVQLPIQPLGAMSLEKAPIYGGQIGVPFEISKLLGEKTDGFFVEAGAYDGEWLSNTIFFEHAMKWTGLLIEPDQSIYQSMRKRNRKAYTANCCLSPLKKPIYMEFFGAGGTGMKFTGRNSTNNNNSGSLILCIPFYTLMLAIGNPAIDYFSLDIEGAEYSVLETLPFNNLNIKVTTINLSLKPRSISKSLISLFRHFPSNLTTLKRLESGRTFIT